MTPRRLVKLPTFWRSLLPPSSGYYSHLEDEDNTLFREVGKYLRGDTASCSKDESSTLLLQPKARICRIVRHQGHKMPFFHSSTALKGLGLFYEALRSHTNTPHSVGLLWTSDQPVAETSTGQHTPLTTD
jgi:hypothetical protein